LTLSAGASIDANAFQSKWGALAAAGSFEVFVKNPAANAPTIEGLLARVHIPTLASGTVQGFMKFYFFARQVW
jgi:hypothetical protein